ncbi:GGDEF domain-containing protein [Streptomyces sp. NPDC056656]|uniref:GGDEF domain-containing protein n=1 Tax=Streptomyces sp. NPDC056656 TaxID=3345895 RepID=UPI003696479E
MMNHEKPQHMVKERLAMKSFKVPPLKSFKVPPLRPLLIALTVLVPTALWFIDSMRLRRRLAAAHRDPVTRLPDRATFTTAARHLLRQRGENALVIFCDMAGFKATNDQYGHDAGNQILAATGARLAAWAGPHGIASRLYGDEFAAVTHFAPGQLTDRLAQLHEELHQPVVVGGQVREVAVSIGAATPTNLRSSDLSCLLRGADVAMYEHKNERTGLYRVATHAHADAPSIHGRRIGRPGAASLAN